MRLFVAIPVPGSVEEALADARRRLGPSLPGVRWTAPGRLHLTLKFLGETRPDRRGPVEEALHGAFLTERACEIELSGLGAFDEDGRPRVLWAGVARGADALRRAAVRLDDALAAVGVSREDKPYLPHITLGRFRPGARPPAPGFLAGFSPARFGSFTAMGAVLMESRPGPDGPSYTNLRTFPWGNP